MSAEAMKELMMHWGKGEAEVDQLYHRLMFNAVKNLLVTLGSKGSLTVKEKEQHLYKMISDDGVLDSLKQIDLPSLTDQFIRQLIVRKRFKMLLFYYQWRTVV